MRLLLSLLVIFLIIVTGCDKEKLEKDSVSNIYKGTFIRTAPNVKYAPADVTLILDSNSFSGTSDTRNYPAICSGKIKIEGQKLVAVNACMFTADFDWTFIFNGEYEMDIFGNELTLTRSYPGNVYDYYILQKQ